jgi:hypothetical protein
VSGLRHEVAIGSSPPTVPESLGKRHRRKPDHSVPRLPFSGARQVKNENTIQLTNE